MCFPLVFEFSVGIGGFVIGLGQISFFFSKFVGTWPFPCEIELFSAPARQHISFCLKVMYQPTTYLVTFGDGL